MGKFWSRSDVQNSREYGSESRPQVHSNRYFGLEFLHKKSTCRSAKMQKSCVKQTMSSLNAVQITAFCYVLECQPRHDLPNAPASYYIGSTSNVNMRISQHFNGSGSRFTVAFKPIRVAELDVTPRLTAQEVLSFENETTLRYMERIMAENPDNPDAWRAVAGGSYCKIDQSMPHELRRRLRVSSTEGSA